MKVAILGAAGQIGQLVADNVLEQTDYDVVLVARNVQRRLTKYANIGRVTIKEGDFLNQLDMDSALEGVDAVYVNDMRSDVASQTIVTAMKKNGVSRIIVASILGIYHEVPGAYGRWNASMVTPARIQQLAKSTAVIENSGLQYTILRLPWLYNGPVTDYQLTKKGENYIGTEISRATVAQFIVDMFQDKTTEHHAQSYGITIPGIDGDKPSFY